MALSVEEIAGLQDAMDQIIEVVNGYRAKLEAAGYSPTAAEEMAVEYHRMAMRSFVKGGEE